jgi:mannose-6-phosphate isomerase-like protein (cupin superfamily)
MEIALLVPHAPEQIPTPGATLNAPGKALTFLAASPEILRFREDIGFDADPVPLHRHLAQTERFTVLSGTLEITIADQIVRLGEGESLEVPPGVLHTYAPGSAEIGQAAAATLIEVELWPARHADHFFEVIYGLTRERRLPPRNLRDGIALMALAHRHRFIFGRQPVWLMRGVSGVCALIAAVFRIDAWVPRFLPRAPSDRLP